MKRIIQITLLLAFSLLISQAMAQTSTSTAGPVWRVTNYKTKPGKWADYNKWLREYRARILAEMKRAGLILDYKFYTKPVGNNSPGDWDISESVCYRNYAEALDAKLSCRPG